MQQQSLSVKCQAWLSVVYRIGHCNAWRIAGCSFRFMEDCDWHASNMAQRMPLLGCCLAADGPRSSDERDRVPNSAARLGVVVPPHMPHALVPGQVSGVDCLTAIRLRLA